MRLLLKRYPIATLLTVSVLAFWPVITWYRSRVLAADGEVWSLLPLLAAAYFLRRKTPYQLLRVDVRPALIVLALYCLSYWFLPQIFRAMLALSVLALVLSADQEWRRIPVSIWGLLLLALPVVASLQFYLGYPVRVLAGEISLLLLKLNGLSVVREGVVLNWGGTLISIDAPCSGIKMLWTGLFMGQVLAAAYRLQRLHTIYLLVITVLIVIIGNALRVTSLFYIETGLVKVPNWAHDTIGLMTFVFVAVLVAWQAQKLLIKGVPCRTVTAI